MTLKRAVLWASPFLALAAGCTPTVVAICVVIAPPAGSGEAALIVPEKRHYRFESNTGTCKIEMPATAQQDKSEAE